MLVSFIKAPNSLKQYSVEPVAIVIVMRIKLKIQTMPKQSLMLLTILLLFVTVYLIRMTYGDVSLIAADSQHKISSHKRHK